MDDDDLEGQWYREQLKNDGDREFRDNYSGRDGFVLGDDGSIYDEESGYCIYSPSLPKK